MNISLYKINTKVLIIFQKFHKNSKVVLELDAEDDDILYQTCTIDDLVAERKFVRQKNVGPNMGRRHSIA